MLNNPYKSYFFLKFAKSNTQGIILKKVKVLNKLKILIKVFIKKSFINIKKTVCKHFTLNLSVL